MYHTYTDNKLSLVIALVLSLFANHSYANQSIVDNLLLQAHAQGIENNPVWLKLLHYNEDGTKSDIVSENFFLARNGQEDPDAELISTITAYYDAAQEHPNQSAKCRFPARYYWLNKQLNLPGYKLQNKDCSDFLHKRYFEDVDSISVLLISGYYGNPASTFGHSLLRLNSKNQTDSSLFDHTYNFGATLPPDVNSISYIIKGLNGGFQGVFSDRYFYTQDMVYSRTEFRDIWDYTLNLTEDEKTFMLLHLWELEGVKFNYYFFDKNCAYRITEVLELVTGEDFLADSSVWYAPVETFHSLTNISMQRLAAGKPGLLRGVRFIPSSRRALYNQILYLQADEVDIMNDIISKESVNITERLAELPMQTQIRIVNTLLAYYQYHITAQQPHPSAALNQAKNRVLLTRLLLPAAKPDDVPEKPLLSPAESSPPFMLGLGSAQLSGAVNPYLQIYVTPYSYDVMSRAGHTHDELVVLDTVLGVSETEGVFIDKLDLLRVRALEANSIPIDGEGLYSWQARLGAERVSDSVKPSQLDGVLSFGLGKNFHLFSASLYIMADLAYHTNSGLAIEPNIGFVYSGSSNLRMEWLYRRSYDTQTAVTTNTSTARLQYQLSKKHSLRAEWSRNQLELFSASYLYHW